MAFSNVRPVLEVLRCSGERTLAQARDPSHARVQARACAFSSHRNDLASHRAHLRELRA